MNFINNGVKNGHDGDCTIRALSTLSGLDYHVVSSVLRHYAGKRDNKGFDIYSWLDAHDGLVFGLRFVMCLRHAPTGRFLIGNKRHVRVLIDGVSHDSFQSSMGYRWCYRVEPSGVEDKPLKLARIFSELRKDGEKVMWDAIVDELIRK